MDPRAAAANFKIVSFLYRRSIFRTRVTRAAACVRVPVLSSTRIFTRPAVSTWEPPLIKIPWTAAWPMATDTAVDEDRRKAQGQVTIMVAMARNSEPVMKKAAAARVKETGTMYWEIFRLARPTSPKSVWADSMSRIMAAIRVWSPVFSTITRAYPSSTRVPARTAWS